MVLALSRMAALADLSHHIARLLQGLSQKLVMVAFLLLHRLWCHKIRLLKHGSFQRLSLNRFLQGLIWRHLEGHLVNILGLPISRCNLLKLVDIWRVR
jgi:hypothetical protein